MTLLRRGRIPRDKVSDEAYRLLHDILWNDCWPNIDYQSPESIATTIIRQLKKSGYSIQKDLQ